MSALNYRYAAAASFLTAAFNVYGQELPSVGIVYNTNEHSSLTYSCKSTGGDQLSCDFVQSAIRPKATIEDLPEYLEANRKRWAGHKPGEECQTFRDIVAVLEGKKVAPDQKGFASMTAVQKADGLALGRAGLAYCAKASTENVDALSRLLHEKERRTCKVSTQSFRQTFRKADANTNSSWVVQDKPSGPCGIVQLSRFESEKSSAGGTFWKYIARKAVTNPAGEIPLLGKCSGLDEGTHTYHWRAIELQLSCDYIEFSPL